MCIRKGVPFGCLLSSPRRFDLGHERNPLPGAECLQIDFAFRCPELRSAESTVAANDNSLVPVADCNFGKFERPLICVGRIDEWYLLLSQVVRLN